MDSSINRLVEDIGDKSGCANCFACMMRDDSLLQLVSQRNPIFQNQGLLMIVGALRLTSWLWHDLCNYGSNNFAIILQGIAE
jgi:hypothetical protein